MDISNLYNKSVREANNSKFIKNINIVIFFCVMFYTNMFNRQFGMSNVITIPMMVTTNILPIYILYSYIEMKNKKFVVEMQTIEKILIDNLSDKELNQYYKYCEKM
jgi:hypothetical protein